MKDEVKVNTKEWFDKYKKLNKVIIDELLQNLQ